MIFSTSTFGSLDAGLEAKRDDRSGSGRGSIETGKIREAITDSSELTSSGRAGKAASECKKRLGRI